MPPPAAHRRHLTLLFADLCNSTELSGHIEAELYAEMLQRLRVVGREVVARHGGLIVRAQGDGLLAIFGQPEPREDDGRRAVEAALDLHAATRELEIEPRTLPRGKLALHSGIHAGLVLLGAGDLELGRFELLGPVPNVAARLSEQAHRDEILVSDETLGPRAPYFVVGDRRLLQLRGRSQPLYAYSVRARAPVDNRYAARALLRGLAPFVGRRAELEALRAAARDVAAGVPRMVALSAGPGMGKTRLAEDFLRQSGLADADIHRGYCESYLSAEPLQPFLQVLRALFGLGHGLAPAEAARRVEAALSNLDPALLACRDDVLRALSLPLPGGESRRPHPERTLAALRELFDTLAARRPLTLFIDDWQWADDASRQALAAVRSLARPIFVLLATRDAAADGLAAAGATVLDLAPLSAAEGRQTIERLLPGADPFDAAEIHSYGGGNPLFIEELCHSAAVRGRQTPSHRERGSAAWLDSLIASRVARLPEEQARVVRAAAIVGPVVPAWLLQHLTGRAEDDPLVRALAEQDFIFPGGQPGTLRFKHGITRDVIYESVGLRERQAMHRQVAEVLAARDAAGAPDDACEALAYHYGAADLPAEAARFAELAGDKAAAASALDRVRTQYRAALAALDALGDAETGLKRRWISIVQRLGMAYVFDPLGIGDGLALFERGVTLAREIGDLPMLAHAEYWLGYIAYAKGDARKSIRHERIALELARQVGDERLEAQIAATLGQALTSASDYGQALPLLDEAVAAKRRHVRGGGRLPVGSAFTLATKGLVLGDQGHFDTAAECLAEALALVHGTGHQIESSVLGWVAAVQLWRGHWADALRSATEAGRVADRCKSGHLLAMHQAQAGFAEWMLTQRPEAVAAIRAATAWIESRQGRLFLSLNHGWLAKALATQGQSDEARRHAARALRRARALDRIGEAMACRAMALDAARDGELARAQVWLARAARSADARDSAHERAVNDLCAAEVLLAVGQRGPARPALDRAGAAFQQMRMPWHLARAERLQAEL